MKQFIFMFTIVCCLFTFSISHAATVDELLKNPNLDPSTRQNIVDALNKTKEITPDKVSKWIEMFGGFGEAFAKIIKEICVTLNVEVNTFLKSPVGKLVAFVIVYKVVGQEIIKTGAIFIALSIVTSLYLYLLTHFFIRKKVTTKIEKGHKEFKYIDKYDWSKHDSDTKFFVLFIMSVAWVIAIFLLILGL